LENEPFSQNTQSRGPEVPLEEVRDTAHRQHETIRKCFKTQFPPGTWRTQRRLNSLLEPGEPRGGSIPSWNMENPEEAQFPPATWRTQRRLRPLLEQKKLCPRWLQQNQEDDVLDGFWSVPLDSGGEASTDRFSNSVWRINHFHKAHCPGAQRSR